MSRAPNHYAASYLILIKDGKVLLQKRSATKWMDGFWSVPAGHLEGKESVINGLKREIKEEIGIDLEEKDLSLKHVMHRVSSDNRVYIDFFFTAEKWSGKLENTESHKHDAIEWFPLKNLPENVIPFVRHGIEKSLKNVFFSEDIS